MKKRLITSALPYVNNIPHLGNLIQVLSADVFARFCRQRGYETLYICGADEYGTATETRALQEHIAPKQLCDRFYKIHKEIYDWFAIDFDHFGRTSCAQQTQIVQQIYRAVSAGGFIRRQNMEQTFCLYCQRFLADRYICGNCPHCGGTNARGDQCEDCGTLLDPIDLLEPRCNSCGQTPQRRSTEHLFLHLPALKETLETWLEEASARGHWAKNALQMSRSWLRDGLKPRCITRDLSWGVPVPEMPGKVFYVWFDAPIGYISITAELLEQRGEGTEAWREWWQNPEEVELFQFIGKDNIPFHTVLFPSSLLAAQAGARYSQAASREGNRADEPENWTLLHHMSSSEYLNYESGKFSKTRGVGIFGNDCQNTGIPADCWRFYLLYNRPEKNDYEFTWADFQQQINRELIGNLGNLVNRTLSFLQRFFAGRLLPMEQVREHAEITDFFAELRRTQRQIADKLEWCQLKEALHLIMAMADCGNKTFQAKEPWMLVKSDGAKIVVHAWLTAWVCLIYDLSICLRPYLPQTAEKMRAQLGLPNSAKALSWQNLGAYECLFQIGQRDRAHKLPEPQKLFRQLEDDCVAELRSRFDGSQNTLAQSDHHMESAIGKQKSESPKNKEKRAPQKQPSVVPNVSPVERWAQSIDLRVGHIVEIASHPDAERLFVEKIDCGEAEPRTVVSGLAEHYRSEELLGQNVVVVANLKPAKLRGVKSMGMILAASSYPEESGQSRLVEVLHPTGEPGQRVVVQGFEQAAPPAKRASISDFFAVKLLLHEGRAHLQDPLQKLPQSQTEALRPGPCLILADTLRELRSRQLQNGTIS